MMDPLSYFLVKPVFCDRIKSCGMCYPVYGMTTLAANQKRVAHVVTAADLPLSEWSDAT